MIYLFKRIGSLNPSGYKAYFFGTCAAICTGMVYPAFGVVYSLALAGFSLQDPHERRHAGDRNALWLFIISVLSAFAIGIQNWMYNDAASRLSAVLREKSFMAILSQDIEYFDKEENNTGSLTTGLSDNPQKVFGLAGITLGAYVFIISFGGLNAKANVGSQYRPIHCHRHSWFRHRSYFRMESFPCRHRYVNFHIPRGDCTTDTIRFPSLLPTRHLRRIHSFACRRSQGPVE